MKSLEQLIVADEFIQKVNVTCLSLFVLPQVSRDSSVFARYVVLNFRKIYSYLSLSPINDMVDTFLYFWAFSCI